MIAMGALSLARQASAVDAYLTTQRRAPSLFTTASSAPFARPTSEPIAVTAGGAPPPAAAAGPSLAVIGASVVGLGVVGFLVYKARKKTKKR